MQHLIIDHGNTRTKLFIFEEVIIVHRVVIVDLTLELLTGFLKSFPHVSKVGLSATGHFDDSLKIFLQKKYNFIELTHETKIPITNHYKTPKTLGKDRLAAVVAAHDLYPAQNVMIIDAGTCVTYDFVTVSGDYYGGSISPGLQMRLRAMHEFTAKLPLVGIEYLLDFIGSDTTTALQTGAQYGLIHEIEGFQKMYVQRFGACKTLLTGGDALFIAQHLVHLQIETQNDLVAMGINVVLNHHY